MFNGTSQSNSNPSYTPMTGLAAFQLIAVNPSQNILNEITGTDKFEANYAIRQDLNGKDVRPLTLWFKSGDIVKPMTINIGMFSNKTKSGKTQFIDAKGQFKYADSIENCQEVYSNFNPIRPTFEGEFELYTLIQRIVKYKPTADDANFIKDCENAGITIPNLYNGDYTGLQKVIETYNSSRIGLVLSVKERKVQDENGNEKIIYRQTIISKPESFFTLMGNQIDKYHLDRLKKLIEEKQASGYPLSNDLFTIELMPFDKEKCVNQIPVPETNSGSKYNF